MDFTILAVVLLLCGGIPLRNKIYKERKKKKEDKKKKRQRKHKTIKKKYKASN